MNEHEDRDYGPATKRERLIVLVMVTYALSAAVGATWLIIQVGKILWSSPHRGMICGIGIVLIIVSVGIAGARETNGGAL